MGEPSEVKTIVGSGEGERGNGGVYKEVIHRGWIVGLQPSE